MFFVKKMLDKGKLWIFFKQIIIFLDLSTPTPWNLRKPARISEIRSTISRENRVFQYWGKCLKYRFLYFWKLVF